MKTWLFLAFCLILLLTACRGDASPVPSGGSDEVFRPPSAALSASPLAPVLQPDPTALSTETLDAMPSPTPPCADNLRYMEDLTIPDGSSVAAGAVLDKRWLVENAGSCNWDDRYRIKLIAGPALGVPEEQALYPARSSTQATIQILFNAPQEAGTYRSAWQAYNPQGQPFGDPIFIEVSVSP